MKIRAKEQQQANGPTQPLTYEQEVHAVLWALRVNTESLLQYLHAQCDHETGEAKKLTKKVIEHVEWNLERAINLIPQALERRESASLPNYQEVQQLDAKYPDVPSAIVAHIYGVGLAAGLARAGVAATVETLQREEFGDCPKCGRRVFLPEDGGYMHVFEADRRLCPNVAGEALQPASEPTTIEANLAD